MRKILQLILTYLLVTPALLFGGTTGKLTGKITDAATKEPLPFVNVLILGTNYGAATDIDGNYVILNIPPGKYNIKAQSVGYQPVISSDVTVNIDLTTTTDFELSASAVELEAIVVEGKMDAVKKDITSSQSLVSSETIEALPVSELDDVLQLQAGVTRDADGGFHIRGGRTTEIAYWVNGISVTDAYDNSRGIQIDNNSIQELQVISGTFNAEYGNAMSGIVNTVTKEGGRDYHGSIYVYGGDHASNFTEYFPHIDDVKPFANYNLQASLNGPVPFTNDIVTFFINGRYYYDDGYMFGERRYNPDGTTGNGEVVPMNWRKNSYGQANFSFAPATGLKINLEGLYSKEDFQDYNHEYRWNPDGDVNKFAESYNGTATITHMLSPVTFYTVKGSFFNKEFNEHTFDSPTDPRYQHPDSLNRIDNYTFRTTGTNLHRFYRETQTVVGKLDFTSQVSKEHLLKAGAEVRSHDLQFDDYTLEPLEENGVEVTPFTPSIPDESSSNRYKYNNKPLEVSVYVQDKIEFEDVIINIGLRFDYFDANGKVLVDPTDPNIYAPLRAEMEALSIAEREPYYYKDSKAKTQVSPRFGVAYPISATGVVHFSYGHFLQIPPFQYLFQNGPYKVPNAGSYVAVYGNPDLEAQKTVMYEIGFRQEFFTDFMIDVTGFYRDVRDWISSGSVIETRNLTTYSIFVNKDYANVKGVTLTLNKRFSNNFAFDLNYTYQSAEGTNSTVEEDWNATKNGTEPTLYLTPMDWDQNHLLNASLLYGIDGWGFSLLGRYGTGLPYDPTTTVYTSDRGISSGLLKNSRRRPAQFTLDLKVDRTFRFMGFDITGFVKVYNLLDNRIAVNVFGDTGQPNFTTETQTVADNPARQNTVAEYVKYPTHYGEPRNLQFGLEISF
jgi:outer membrane receptor for ferrienterochelin and colicin